MERQCLDLLLCGNQPVILFSSKSLNRLKLGKSSRTDMKEDRLLVLSPFDRTIRWTNAASTIIRNNLVAAMSVGIQIPHATVGGKIWGTARQSIEIDHPVFTFDDEANTQRMDVGAKAYTIDILCEQIFQCFQRIKTPHEDHGQIK